MKKLYQKNITSLEQLRREKALKKKEASRAFKDMSPNKMMEGNSLIGDVFSAGTDVLTSKGLVNKAFALAIPLLKLGAARLERDMVKSIAREVLTGYAKGKGIELGIKVVKLFFKRKNKD